MLLASLPGFICDRRPTASNGRHLFLIIKGIDMKRLYILALLLGSTIAVAQNANQYGYQAPQHGRQPQLQQPGYQTPQYGRPAQPQYQQPQQSFKQQYRQERANDQIMQHGAGGCTPNFSTGGCL
jgi:hypothetical protein